MPRCLSLFLCLLLLSSTITFGAVVQQDRETPVEDFETAPLQLSANDDGGKSPVFEQSHENPKSGTSCVKITYTGGDRWGNLQMPFHLTQETTGIRLWIRCQTCQPKSVMHLWLFESDGDGWVSPPIRLPMLDEGWNQVQFLLDDFTYQPRGNGKKDIQSTNRMLIGCNYADSIVYVDDIRLFTQPTSIQPRAKSGRLLGDFTFDLNKPSSDWWATLTAEYDPLQFMPESTSPNQGRRGMNESWWAVEQERVRKMGLHGMRLWFQIDWWEPTNDNDDPYHYAPDYSGFDIHGPRMESMYRFLDMCQKYNVAVQLDFGWKLDLPT
ncbi:MAG TPA: hypothetical protein VHV83_05405, partial [Armatimonadota bacterium]|nr:hypothetical protein [Armatimonadota bacterium]